jgi:hypothetical protein
MPGKDNGPARPGVIQCITMLMTALFVGMAIQSEAAEIQKYRAQIVPPASQARYEELGWRSTLWSGVLQAQREDRPILLWAMNGHPLACT